jgi:cellulose synthase/poly-beta-1,6-N-acetylglucosamine synthase-like glycosyltransferase
MRFAEIVFWGSLTLTFYAYVAYPALIWVLARLSNRRDHEAGDEQSTDDLPTVSLVIAAYREEKVILERLQNAVMLDYPADRLEIIVGCDGHEDLTGDLVHSFNDSRVRLIQFPQRRGKASVLNDCIPQARGEIVVLSDANTMMEPEAVRLLVRHFRTPRVGGVCGKLILVDPLTGENVDGMYWKFENFLKRCEARFGALLGFNGAIYAIRKSLFQPLPANTLVDDFVIGMRIYQSGLALVYEERAVAIEETSPTIESEFHRRARIGAGNFQSLVWLYGLLNPLRGRVAFTFWSHKVLRWCCPAFLIAAIISNAYLSRDPFYLQILLLHELFYLAAFTGLWCVHGGRWQRFVKIPGMFVSMNAALLVGFWRWASGLQGGTWKRTVRAQEVPAAAGDSQRDSRALATKAR